MGPKPPPLTEAERLSQVIQEIDFDTAAVPKGSYALNEAHLVVPSSDFKGLGLTEAKALASYVHFRPPTSVACLKALARTDVQSTPTSWTPLRKTCPKAAGPSDRTPPSLLSLF